MKFQARIQDGKLVFGSKITEQAFYEMNGMELTIETDDAPSNEVRRYFEGAVVPYVFYQHPQAGWKTFRDAREALKLEFLGAFIITLAGERVKSAISSKVRNDRFKRFVTDVTNWMNENGLEVPDPEAYKRWRDSAPIPGEVYPPLARLKQKYMENKAL